MLVVYGIYTGNLIAFLTVTELKLPFNSLQEMAQQSQYKYGTEAGIIQLQVFQVGRMGQRERKEEGVRGMQEGRMGQREKGGGG